MPVFEVSRGGLNQLLGGLGAHKKPSKTEGWVLKINLGIRGRKIVILSDSR